MNPIKEIKQRQAIVQEINHIPDKGGLLFLLFN